MEQVRVSVIIPMYNASRYILETLESVRGQTYENREIIVVDDGSTDSSAEKVQEFMARYPGTAKLVFHPGRENRGTSASRNLGMNQAQGDLLCFLDADDVWAADFLDFFVGLFDRSPELAMAYGPALLWHTGQNALPDQVQHLGLTSNGMVEPYALFKMFLTGEADTPSPSGVMLRRAALLAVGGWEESFTGMYDDQVVYSKVLLGGGGVFVTDRCLYRYRQHVESLCKQAARKGKNAGSREKYLAWLQQYLVQRGQLSEDIDCILAEHMWYVQRAKEIELLPSAGWWRQKTGALRSFMTLVAGRKNVKSAIHLARRVAGQQIVSFFRTLRRKSG